jgi:hypothetical protein
MGLLGMDEGGQQTGDTSCRKLVSSSYKAWEAAMLFPTRFSRLQNLELGSACLRRTLRLIARFR